MLTKKINRAKILVAILLAIFLIQAVSSMLQKNITGDESFYLPQGYYYLNTGKTFILGNPPLISAIQAIPLLFLDLNMPANHEELYLNNDYSSFEREFFYVYNTNEAAMTMLGRIPSILFAVILGLFVFKWAKKLYGEKAALFALFLFMFSPNILAYFRLATTDPGFTLSFFLSIFFFWRFVNQRNWKNMALVGIFLGLALISKTTALIIIPLYILFALVAIFHSNKFHLANILKKGRKDIKIWAYSLISIFLIGLLIINIAYGFRGSFKSLGKNLQDDSSLYFDKSVYNAGSITNKLVSKEGILKNIVHFGIGKIPIIIPYPYLKETVAVIKMESAKNLSGGFIFGKNYYGGKWYYFLFAFLIKTPIAMIILIILTIIFYRKIKNKNCQKPPIRDGRHIVMPLSHPVNVGWFLSMLRNFPRYWNMSAFSHQLKTGEKFLTFLDEFFIILPILIILLFFSLSQSNAGLRYILPIYPFLFIFVSKIVTTQEKSKRKIVLPLIILLSVWYLLSSLFIFPHYLAYFNEFVGPENGYKFLTDSNIDWGQDLKNLKKYMDKNNIEKVKLAYFGNALPDYYRIDYEKLAYFGDPKKEENCTPANGIIAISVTFLQDTRYLKNESCFEWLRQYEPIEKIGYSIFVYDIK